MRLSAGEHKDVGQIKTLDKFVHNFDVNLPQRRYPWVLEIYGSGQVTNSLVALSFTNLGTNALRINFMTLGLEGSTLQQGETKEVFKGPLGNLSCSIMTIMMGQGKRLHYRVALSFSRTEQLLEPIQITADEWTPSL